MRIVALYAISHRRRMHCTFYLGGVLVGMAGQAKSGWSCRDQFYPSDIFIGADLVTTGASHGDR
jgi:hypothetical protein